MIDITSAPDRIVGEMRLSLNIRYNSAAGFLEWICRFRFERTTGMHVVSDHCVIV